MWFKLWNSQLHGMSLHVNEVNEMFLIWKRSTGAVCVEEKQRFFICLKEKNEWLQTRIYFIPIKTERDLFLISGEYLLVIARWWGLYLSTLDEIMLLLSLPCEGWIPRVSKVRRGFHLVIKELLDNVKAVFGCHMIWSFEMTN